MNQKEKEAYRAACCRIMRETFEAHGPANAVTGMSAEAVAESGILLAGGGIGHLVWVYGRAFMRHTLPLLEQTEFYELAGAVKLATEQGECLHDRLGSLPADDPRISLEPRPVAAVA